MRRLPTLLPLLFLLAACAGPGYFEAVPPSNSNKAVVYLYRPEADNPGRQPLRYSYPDVLIDEQSVGTLEFNSHRRVELAPGRHSLRITGLTRQAKWEPRDIKQEFSVAAGETKYLKLDVRFNLSEMTLGSPGPSYLIHVRPMRADDAVYEIRNTAPQNP
ncbi:hypothetical protein A9179_08645 [Pseudomonas alcaligenes]|uniref:DUF2846 domain-containing protein n=1 Tax=Aquipseudomonas alcaligenes TaxID=43263 RepID=A0ABR7S0U6_AQUAC|nr:DUF2846 domain-containing protein [Pseudomonas alcaligenes]MBC9250337.1 hypothetical protein [Pseudomonas alcaligenes]